MSFLKSQDHLSVALVRPSYNRSRTIITMSSELIQTGLQIDYSKGLIIGVTLTYNSRQGSLLITATSIIVQITGTAVQALVAFWLHQHLTPADHTYQDKLEAQRSVVLRNSSAVSTILDLYSIGKMWYKHSPRAQRRSVTVIAMLFLIIVSFTVTGMLVILIVLNPQRSYDLVQPGLRGLILSGNSVGFDSDLMRTARERVRGASVSVVVTVELVQWEAFYTDGCI